MCPWCEPIAQEAEHRIYGQYSAQAGVSFLPFSNVVTIVVSVVFTAVSVIFIVISVVFTVISVVFKRVPCRFQPTFLSFSGIFLSLSLSFLSFSPLFWSLSNVVCFADPSCHNGLCYTGISPRQHEPGPSHGLPRGGKVLR